MAQITLLSVGISKDKNLISLQEDYIKRIKKYFTLKLIDIKEPRYGDTDSSKYFKVITKEINSKLKQSDLLICLDKDGEMPSSEKFSTILNSSFHLGKDLVFLVGGSIGIPDEIKNKAYKLISFSRLTFPHKLFKLIFLEQLYRGFTILKGEKYHK